MTSSDHTRALDEMLDGYFARLRSVACVTIVDELMRSLTEFYDAAVASDRLAEFRTRAHDQLALDHGGALVYLAPSRVNLQLTLERWPGINFRETREHASAAE